ncbi:MAG: GIY-YIG nuclease family protein [Gemmataceae bacterium]
MQAKTVIKNYGLLWNRDYVHWGAPRNKGTLLGYRSKKRIIDFRDQIGVYVLYDKDYVPVYVGQAGSGSKGLFSRLKQHMNDHLWNRWQHFSWFGLHPAGTKILNKGSGTYTFDRPTALNIIEGILIAITEPRLNRQSAKFEGVEKFHQWWEDECTKYLPENVPYLVEELGKKFDALKRKIDKM